MMSAAFPEAFVHDWETYERSCAALPDPNDRHVLAAAIKCDAAVIVTDNIRDFPEEVLETFAIEPMSTDDFLADAIDLNQGQALAAIDQMRAAFTSPGYSMAHLLTRMEEIGLNQSAALLRGAR